MDNHATSRFLPFEQCSSKYSCSQVLYSNGFELESKLISRNGKLEQTVLQILLKCY